MRRRVTIDIERYNSDDWSGMPSQVLNVPINRGSTRKYHLMGEDSVTLVFSLAEPEEFMVGDYIRDEVFGLFFLTEKQLPTYNKATGGYDYQLRFDRAYKLWENHILMLTAPMGAASVDVSEEDGTTKLQVHSSSDRWKRQEAIWCLTGPLIQHLEQVLCNLVAAGLTYYGRPYKVRIHPSASKAKEIRYMDYKGEHICSALTAIANAYECEWWVTYETENNVEYGWLNFGKCELANEPVEFVLGDNVETMTASRDMTSYANRLYVFGGTKNVPDSYRRKLYLDVDTVDNQGGLLFRDSTRAINPYTMIASDYIIGEAIIARTGTLTPTYDTHNLSTIGGTIHYQAYALASGSEEFSFGGDSLRFDEVVAGIRFYAPQLSNTEATLVAKLIIEDANSSDTLVIASLEKTEVFVADAENEGSFYWKPIISEGGIITPEAGSHRTCKLKIDMTLTLIRRDTPTTQQQYAPNNGTPVEVNFGLYPVGVAFPARLIWNGTTYDITFNPLKLSEGEPMSYFFRFDNGVPTGFYSSSNWEGQRVELLDYLSYAIPMSYYTDDTDDPSSVIGLGERRVRLPFATYPLNYVQSLGYIEVQRVERTILNDNIYPKCFLRVTSVSTESRTDALEYSDGTRYTWPWTAYTLEAEQIDGSAFPFRREFVKDGEKLQALFINDYEEQSAYEGQELQWTRNDGGYLLAGMTFDVSFREERGNDRRFYTLIRNEDYGAKLPNEILRPSVGDTFVLLGWDVKAMDDLGLLANAEAQLKTFAEQYLDAIINDGWTFRCNMMSVEDGSLLPEGTKVEVMHDALVGGSKVSRIIGYELKLDIPWDSPVYEVGETDAFSRIKQLERKVQRL